MPYKDIVKILKKYDQDQSIELILDPGKKGLVEECSVRTEYEGYGVSFVAATNWRSADIRTTEMTVGEFVKLLKKKLLSDMTDEDFPSMNNENSYDGSMEFYDIEWDADTPESIIEEADMHDLYFKGDIDCECKFDGLDNINVYLEDDFFSITDNPEED